MVLPAELLSVNYAREVRRFLLRRFGRVRLIMFEERVFPGVQEEVLLLLAEGNGGAQCLEVHQARNVKSLGAVVPTRKPVAQSFARLQGAFRPFLWTPGSSRLAMQPQ